MPRSARRHIDKVPGSNRTPTRVVFLALIVALSAAYPGAQSGGQPGIPRDLTQSFDIRMDKSAPGAAAYLERVGERAARSGHANALATAIAQGWARLEQGGAVTTETNPELGTLEIVSTKSGAPFLTGPSDDRVATLRAFLSGHAEAYGLSEEQVNSLEVVADYVNPSGNMGWVELEQKINGIPVFRGYVRGGFTAKGELARTTGQLAPGLDAASLLAVPAMNAADAVARATAQVGWHVAASALTEKAVEDDGRRVTLSRGPMAADARASRVYFPLAPGVARLAWATVIWGDPDVFLIVLDAEDGTVLFRKNLTDYQTQPVAYSIYNDDSPAPASPSPAVPGANYQAPYITRTAVALIGNEAPHTFNNLGWITDDTNQTQGNNVIAGIDRDGFNGVDAPVTGSGTRIFDFAYNPQTDDPLSPNYQRGDVTNMFYWTNKFHDLTYTLGFTEAARNFQNDNFGRGGVGGDRVSAEGQDSSGVNNANFATSPDGTSGRMQMYLWNGPVPDRAGDLDRDIILHELAHGLSNRLHANASGLSTNMARGMGEGWSDFYARALVATAGEDVNGRYTIGGWATYLAASEFSDNYYYGIRRFPYAPITVLGGPSNRPFSPLTFADVDGEEVNINDGAYPRGPFGSNTADQVHNIGEVWANALFEVRRRFITRLGFAVGNQRILQFVTDGMKLDPAGPTMLQARDAILAAAQAGGGNAADVADIWAGFAARGFGIMASIENVGTGNNDARVTEDFTVPGGATPTFSIDDVSVTEGNAGTTTATFTVTLTNPSVNTPRVNYATADNTATSGVTRTSLTALAIPGLGPASPYPSTLSVSGVTGTIQRLTVRLSALTHSWPADIDLILVGPGGQRVMLMSDAGGGTEVTSLNLAFADGAPPMTTAALLATTYAPTDLLPGESLAAPAPPAPYSTTLSVFNGTDPNGTWSLYAQDDETFDAGTLAGFSLTFTTSTADYVPVAGSLEFPPGTTTRAVAITINGDVTSEGNETFVVNLTNATGASIGDAQGTGTIVDDEGVLTPTSVDDAYSTAFNTPLAVAATGVLANDNSNGGGAMTAAIVSTVSSGSLTLNSDGGFTYTPTTTFAGIVTFTYRAVREGGAGNIATATITVDEPTTPQPPTELMAYAVGGNLVTLRWTPAATGPAATGFVIEGGLGPGDVLASLPTGSASPILTFSAPSGAFYVRVHQVSGTDRSPASNEIRLYVNVPAPPSAPAALLALVNGSGISLAWRNTYEGGPPASLVLDASGTVNGSLPIAMSDSLSLGPLPSGTYTLSLRAINAGGSGGSSSAVSVSVPAVCSGAPLPPSNFLVYKAGGLAFAIWDPATSGSAATSYVLNVGGPFSGSIPTTARALSGVPPPGMYTLTVVAVNACGTSAPTAAQTLVFP